MKRKLNLNRFVTSRPFLVGTFNGFLLLTLAVFSVNQYLKQGYYEQVKMSAEVTARGVNGLIREKFEQYELISRAIANHHQDRILELATGAGYPYDLNVIANEVKALFGEIRQFAVLDVEGDAKVGSKGYFLGPVCQEHVKQVLRNPLVELDGELHQCELGSHYDVVINVIRGEERAAFYLSFHLVYLQDLLSQFSGPELRLVVVQGKDQSNVVLTSNAIASTEPVEVFDDVTVSQIMANIQIAEGGWRLVAVPTPDLFKDYSKKIDRVTWLAFIGVLLLFFIFVYYLRVANRARFEAEQKASYSALFNAGPTILIEKNLQDNGAIEYVSPNVYPLLGFTSEQIIREYVYTGLIYPKDRKMFDSALISAIESQKSKLELEFRMLRSDRQYIWVYALMHIDYDPKGTARKIQGYITSIHAQKMAENQAISLINNAPDAILVTDAEGIILQANKRVKEIFGYEGDDLLGVSVTVLLPGFETSYKGLSLQLETEQEELEGYKFNGESIMLGVRLNQLQLQSSSKSIAIVMRDISLQKLAQQQMQEAKERAEQLAASRTHFMAMVSHEIRTPMNGVLGMADLLSSTALDNQQRGYVEVIQQSGDSLMGILNDVLDFSKVEEGGLTLKSVAFEVDKVIDSCLRLLQPQARVGGVTLTTQYKGGSMAYLSGDVMRLRQIVINLLSNAIKFSPDGHVTISVDTQPLADGAVLLSLTFKDDGLGISEADQKTLFQPFMQADNALSRSFGGTGLGLSISKQLVELLGGHISLQSQLGVGSEFLVELPFQQVNEEQHQGSTRLVDERKEEECATAQPFRVLLVEDDAVNQKIAESYLETMNIMVDTVSNGVEAVEFWRMHHQNIDLILMDCQMAVMDGYEATRIIRHEEALLNPQQAVAIIAFTADAYAQNEASARDAGMDDMLLKPFNLEKFKQKIEHWLSSRLSK